MQNRRRRRRQGREEGGSRTHTSLPEQEVGIFLQGSRARARSQSSSGARRKNLARPLQSPAPGWDQPAPRRAMNRLPQLLLWVTTLGKELIFSFLSSPYFAKSLFYPEVQTYFLAPSLLSLKPEKHYFQNSRDKGGGEWGLRVLT